jgi:hypothetical protein
VIGTATSGQAARILGKDAEVDQWRTLASLLWRLDHDRIALNEQTVVVLDEVGMTEDAHLIALTARVEAAGAKLVLVGDHHQLDAVGPGGALAALVRRHPDVVHQLTENRRQRDPAERQALAELRDGEVIKALAWYHREGRIHASADRDIALQRTVDAWAVDTAAGRDTGLYAWRRANVAALNQRARAWMEATGRLSGPELVCPGGNGYRTGDRVVTLAPGPDGRLVTSQRAVIAELDPSHGTLMLRSDDGQQVVLAVDEAGADRLGFGYAKTVHRSQGSTTERAHLFADGGGRELAYVAMSRARESTDVWAVADDLPQAVDDLRRDWSARRTPAWAIDTALPEPGTLSRDGFQALPSGEQARIAALLHAEKKIAGEAVVGVRLPDRAATLGQAEQALERGRKARADLTYGSGVWAGTEAGRAVRDLAEAGAKREQVERTVEHADRWRNRHAARKAVEEWAAWEGHAQARWHAHVAPEISRLDQDIARHQATLNQTAARLDRRQATTNAVVNHGLAEQRDAHKLAARLEAHRNDTDGVPLTADIRRAATRQQQLRTMANVEQSEPSPRPVGPDL